MTTWIISSLLFGYDIVILFGVRINFIWVLLTRFYALSELLSIKNNIFSTKNLISSQFSANCSNERHKNSHSAKQKQGEEALF
jgi:hypothetical protein